MRTIVVVLLTLAALLLTACESSGNGARGGGPSSGGGGAIDDTFTGDTQAFMAEGLRQFSRGDPEWETTRRRWLALGPRESQFLVMSMFAALMKAQRLAAPDLIERSRDELVTIGEPAVPFLTDVLAVGTVKTVYDEVQEKDVPIRVDDDARREASTILAKIGGPAAGPTAAAFRRAETKSGKRFALATLGDMGARGGAAGRDALIAATRDPDWVLRVEAAHGLRGLSDAASRGALEAALGDADDLVRQKAAEALLERRETAALPALRRAEGSARGAGRIVEAGRLREVIARIEAAP